MQTGEAEGAAPEELGSHTSIGDLPDSIVVKIFSFLSRRARANSGVARVCKAWSRLVNSPELIQTISCDCERSDGVQRLERLLAWLHKHGAPHVRSLTLSARAHPSDARLAGAADLTVRERLVCSCMEALAACGSLEQLTLLTGGLNVRYPAWLGSMHSLRQLSLYDPAVKGLRLGSYMSGLSSLQELSVTTHRVRLPPTMPPTLTRVVLKYLDEGLPPQVLALPALQSLELLRCMSLDASSWEGLPIVAPTLKRLVLRPLAYLPAGVAALTQLTALEFEGDDNDDDDDELSKQLGAALQQLRQLQVLSLEGVGLKGPVASALASLPALRGLWIRPYDQFEVELPAGPWTSSLQLLAARASVLTSSLPLLQAASRLEQLQVDCDALVDWHPLFHWAALHPTLQQLCLEMYSNASLSPSMTNDLLRLQRQKPQLLLRITPSDSSQQALARL